MVSDAASDAVQTRHWTVEVDPVVDLPLLRVDSAAGQQMAWIPLSVAAGLEDQDGSESLVLRVKGLPTGAMLSDGERSIKGDGAGGWINLTDWNLAKLTFMGINMMERQVTLTWEAMATEKISGDRLVQSAVMAIDVAPAPRMDLDAMVRDFEPQKVEVLSVSADSVQTVEKSAAVDGGFLPVMETRVKQVASGDEELEQEMPRRINQLELEELEINWSERRKTEYLEIEIERLTRELLELEGEPRFARVNELREVEAGFALPYEAENLEELLEQSREIEEQANVSTELGWFWGLVRSMGVLRERNETRQRTREENEEGR